MDRRKNLRSLADRPAEEVRAIASAGGKACHAKRAQRKLLREIVQACAARKIDIMTMDGTRENVQYDVAMVMSMYEQAIREGNVKAAEFIAKVSGDLDEKPQTNAGLVIQVSAGLAEELKKATE